MMDETMICGDVDERLPDYLEETLDERTERRVRAHIASCDRCSMLMADLDAIRTEAAALPVLTPSRDLWAGIADRIETPVISLGSEPVWVGRRSPAWLIGAIAAGLVFATAGITSVLTRRSVEREFAATTRPATGQVAAVVATPSAQPAARDSAIVAPTIKQSSARVASAPRSNAVAPRERQEVQAPAATTQLVSRSAADVAYNREIVRLREVLQQRRRQLDPETVLVIEQSLRVIDEAIAQSRAALAKDPASAFLRDRLDNSLGKKVELLRTAALLPART